VNAELFNLEPLNLSTINQAKIFQFFFRICAESEIFGGNNNKRGVNRWTPGKQDFFEREEKWNV